MAQTCPDAKYCAFDEHDDTKNILIDTMGIRLFLSFWIVAVGIYGVEEERSGKEEDNNDRFYSEMKHDNTKSL